LSTAAERSAVRRRLVVVPDRLSVAAVAAAGRPAPVGEWSPAEIVRHLIAVEEVVWHSRLRQLATADRPTWPWLEPEPWHGQPDATLDDLLATFAGLRAESVAILDGFNEAIWARSGIHATWGEVGVVELMNRAADHDDEHIASLVAQTDRIR
jgi:hypothetical protein